MSIQRAPTTQLQDPQALRQAMRDRFGPGIELTGFAILWSRTEPFRVGEVLLIPPTPAEAPWRFGRGDGTPGSDRLLELCRQRPGSLEPAGYPGSPCISRTQLHLWPGPDVSVRVENVGRCPLLIDQQGVERCTVQPGDILELRDELLLLCVRRPYLLPEPSSDAPFPLHPFGAADTHGLVGESQAMWELRRQIAFAGPRPAHVLLRGASGTGKELVARALHALSPRCSMPMVARNAATIPESLIDAELFGTAKNYPNAGMPERPGIVGQADGSTLFLDEIGELPTSLQAHLLRVLDQGEYQRLGDARTHRADLRLIGASNRPDSALKHDVLARLKLRITLPDLNARREDVPLIARLLLQRITTEDPVVTRRFMDPGSPEAGPRLSAALVAALTRHRYETNVRELEALLWQSLSHSRGEVLEWVPEMRIDPMIPGTARDIIAAVVTADRQSLSQEPDALPESLPSPAPLSSADAPSAPTPPPDPAQAAGTTPVVHIPDSHAPTDAGRSPYQVEGEGAPVRERVRPAYLSPAQVDGEGAPVRERVRPADLLPEEIQAALDRHDGIQDHAWSELGLPNRFALYRLVRQHGLRVRSSRSRKPDDG